MGGALMNHGSLGPGLLMKSFFSIFFSFFIFNSKGDYTSPKKLPINNVVDVAVGQTFCLYQRLDGIYGRGSNSEGQFGVGSRWGKKKIFTKIPIDNVTISSE